MEFYTIQQVRESVQALWEKLNGFQPQVLLILGSGLGALADEVESPITVPYSEVPHMKHSTAPGHKGQFLFGKLAGKDVAVMQGRLHTYEGWSFADASYPVRVARLLGVAPDHVYCVGDNQNDITMLALSAIPFAPANCAQEVKDWGARVLCHCNDGVIGDVVDILDRLYSDFSEP